MDARAFDRMTYDAYDPRITIWMVVPNIVNYLNEKEKLVLAKILIIIKLRINQCHIGYKIYTKV